MEKFFVGLFLTSVLSLMSQACESQLTYRAAVMDYHPIQSVNEVERVEANLANYVKFIEEAKKKKAEIIVFPESGLMAKTYTSYVPDPIDKIVPCDSKDYNKILKNLSCASKSNSIYSVVNLVEKRDCASDDENCPSKGHYILNTNVVFDGRGQVIARYSKYNLFDELLTDRMKDPEMVFFDTDFGVRFGTFTCFDVLFPTPAQRLIQQYGIRNFVFTTFWFSELPFLTALQAQRGWAETNNVNLLASGVNNPQTGSGGSGIYNGRFGQIVQLMPKTARSRLLVADIPLIVEDSRTIEGQSEDPPFYEVRRTLYSTDSSFDNSTPTVTDDYKLLKDQMHLFTSEVVEEGRLFSKSVCDQHNFCCTFEILMNSLRAESKNYVCRAVVLNGVRRFGQTFRGGVQSCGVVMCQGSDIKNCSSPLKSLPGLFKFEKITITGNFKLKNSFQMPTTLTNTNLEPLPAYKYIFKRRENWKNVEVSLELVWPETDIQSFAIWGRDFTRDMQPVEFKANISSRNIIALLSSFISFLLLIC